MSHCHQELRHPAAPSQWPHRCMASSLHGLLLLSIPAFHHLQVPSALVLSKLVLLPPFMFLLLSHPLIVGNPCKTLHQSMFSFQLPRYPPACVPICFTFPLPGSFPARSQRTAKQRRGAVHFPQGCTVLTASPRTHPRLTAPLLSCCRRKPLPVAEHHPSAHRPSTSWGTQQIRVPQPSSSRA